ncbi:MAG TPA: DUF4232 domain-containing protein [Candidatus Saccharimonadales bacterium]|nr:DUF4232 domain-containing protein [Candidatus Saccharimonadales bacterium]
MAKKKINDNSRVKKLLILLGIVLIMLVIVCVARFHRSRVQHYSQIPMHVANKALPFDFGNKTLLLNKREITFVNGSYKGSSSGYSQDTATIGNKTLSPSQTRAAAILVDSPGGSGTFYYLVGAMNANGEEIYSKPLLLGNRIKIVSVVVEDLQAQGYGITTVRYLEHAANEPMAAEPTQEMTAQYSFQSDGNLLAVGSPITSVPHADCKRNDLETNLALSPGAGNVFGTVTLKNISPHTCQIAGGSFINAEYNPSVTNISIVHVGQTQSQPFILAPNQTIYSQIHYPNGPQCSTGVKTTKVAFSYNISGNETVTFKDMDGAISEDASVQTCNSPADVTQIEIWKMSTTPITP